MKVNVTRSLGLCAFAAGVLLAGCSATHVGESWQCPLAQGSSCASIAEADPAVPSSAMRSAALFGEPLPGAHRPMDQVPVPRLRDQGEACDGACGPLAWFRGLIGFDTDEPVIQQVPVAAVTGAESEPGAADNASLRVPEVLGRIWIAPFVDADGIYREAHWVRVVLEPAGWKLP